MSSLHCIVLLSLVSSFIAVGSICKKQIKRVSLSLNRARMLRRKGREKHRVIRRREGGESEEKCKSAFNEIRSSGLGRGRFAGLIHPRLSSSPSTQRRPAPSTKTTVSSSMESWRTCSRVSGAVFSSRLMSLLLFFPSSRLLA